MAACQEGIEMPAAKGLTATFRCWRAGPMARRPTCHEDPALLGAVSSWHVKVS